MSNLTNVSSLAFAQIVPVETQVTVDGWTDTDLSASIPINAKSVMVFSTAGVLEQFGARRHGDATDTHMAGLHQAGYCSIVPVDSTRHVDYYREGSSQWYWCVGYFS